jgi:hypothetical protein
MAESLRRPIMPAMGNPEKAETADSLPEKAER